jgi:2,5-diketo-D-gluconate reductase A
MARSRYPAVKKIAAAHSVSGAQVALRWVLQQGCALTTATGNVGYMQEDLDTLDGFALSEEEMATLSAIHGPPPPAAEAL